MSREIDTSQWIVFFTKAGLPPNVAANYALIFSENRIQLDMLLDLSKEYLYDMGIKVMGDVIAILRYAKEFHTQLSKEKVFGTSQVTSPNKTVAERMVGHYTRRFSPVQSQPVRSIQAPPKKSTVINLKRKSAEEQEVKRIRRVPPEEEGAYKIKMPSGTTKRTRQILQQQKKLGLASKRSVFSRLGDSAVSSSTDTKKMIKLHKGNASPQVSSSVFERLGPNKGITDDMPTSTVTVDSFKRKGSALPYRGVLKMTVAKNRTVVSTSPSKGTVRTVIKPRQAGFQNVTKTVKLNQINTILSSAKPLGSSTTLLKLSKGSASQGIFGRHLSQSADVRSRLGNRANLVNKKVILTKTIKSANNPSNVFDRLG